MMPLDKEEMKDYINHRLTVAGSDGQIKFTDEAIDEVYKFSEGVPRLINMVCDRALLFGFVTETKNITQDIVKRGVEEIKGQVYEYHK